MNIGELHRYASLLGKKIVNVESIELEYELTRLAFKNRDSVILATLKGHGETPVYSNLLTRREDIVKLLGVNSIEEAYVKIERALSPNIQLETINFNDVFEEVDVDFYRIPFVKFFREDGGHYLSSSIYIICYEGICNASYHRTMRLSRDTVALRIVPRHLNYLVSKYFEKGRDAPVALVLGLDPIQEFAAATTPPLGVFEVEVGAALGGESRIVKTPRYGIPVPASASIIIEGVISRDKRASEGPFTDILLLADVVREQPVFIAEKMYVARRRPLLVHGIIPGLWEHWLLMGLPREAHMYVELKRVVPCVKTVRLTEAGGMWLHAVVSVTRKCSEGDAKLAGITAISAHPSIKHVVVVDEDIDVDDPNMVEWAIATRMKGGDDIHIIRDIRGSTLEPRSRDGIGDKVVFLAITPRNEPYEKYKRVEIP